ncbi:SH3 domain-containing protein [Mesorhizobium sp. LHD-90]|uniref:SH3 domain-containing protein n=1 Tax=Mesorhizobium sp. LHD-90 TaxID=3071414 RepID=UPI0027E1D2E6|nr:SH3 domain-containing protein [Mesorhizobium sp. LHD-90]MDQ6434311.1 SH3 domain-containing protein [Mesorhizobium sp. LHD-90]
MMKLPRLRWLVLGAVVAGAWAMMQEPPKREHWQRQRDEHASVEKKKPSPPAAVAAAPAPKPAEIVTASIPRPQKPVARTETLLTSEKVRLRKEASTSSAVVATLKGGQPVEATVAEGKWRKVSVDGLVGWVHGDYLKAGSPSVARPADPMRPTPAVATVPQVAPAPELAFAPRPKEDVAPEPGAEPAVAEEPTPTAMPISLPEDKSMWGALRPARAPQEGDCQCPYDLMLNGKQCGERSAYAKGKGPQCYF